MEKTPPISTTRIETHNSKIIFTCYIDDNTYYIETLQFGSVQYNLTAYIKSWQVGRLHKVQAGCIKSRWTLINCSSSSHGALAQCRCGPNFHPLPGGNGNAADFSQCDGRKRIAGFPGSNEFPPVYCQRDLRKNAIRHPLPLVTHPFIGNEIITMESGSHLDFNTAGRRALIELL
ncbi:UNVERIFIED_CONTAM: hypothetical protein NCL1_57290 [Trichonephila clavipes]